MRILADENCDRAIVEALRNAGHDVFFALEGARGAGDIELFHMAHREQHVLLTDDLDFGHIAKVETQRPVAVVIVRIGELPRSARIRRVVDAIMAIMRSLDGQIAVIEPSQTRLRAMEKF